MFDNFKTHYRVKYPQLSETELIKKLYASMKDAIGDTINNLCNEGTSKNDDMSISAASVQDEDEEDEDIDISAEETQDPADLPDCQPNEEEQWYPLVQWAYLNIILFVSK